MTLDCDAAAASSAPSAPSAPSIAAVRPEASPPAGEVTGAAAVTDAVEIDPAREALQLIAEGVTQVAGWGVAAISLVRPDGFMQVMAVAGSEEARRTLEGTRTPVAEMMTELAKADDWGHLRFVPHDRVDLEGDFGWVPDLLPGDHADSWHPMDLLIAPLFDDEGTLRGTLSIDLPLDGRRPGPEHRRVLNLYAEQALRAVLTAVEREALAEQVRILQATRRIVVRASRHSSVHRMLQECRSAMLEGFRARGSWVQTFDVAGREAGVVHVDDGREVQLPTGLAAIAQEAATRLARTGEIGEVGRGSRMSALGGLQRRTVHEAMERMGVLSLLFVPLSAAGECLGSLVLTRTEGDPAWTLAERTAAADIGGDLGRALLNARNIARQRRLVRELTSLDAYRSQLIDTVSHELKNPLTAILGHLELLEVLDVPQGARTSLVSMDRAARRLARVADDLLLLSRMGDPSVPVAREQVSLSRLVADAVDLHRVTADKRDITIARDDPGPPEDPTDRVLAEGDPHELDRVVVNLLSNAIKYTHDGRAVSLSVGTDPVAEEVWVACTDQGIGISPEDQADLFTEFFRSRNPEATQQPGTGLGLAIASRIARRHGGRIEVESELGVGSTFRLVLPQAPRRT